MEYFRNKKMGLLKAIKCDCCGNKFIPGNSNGLPNGVGFKLDEDEIVNVCRMCMLNKTKFDEFLKEKGYEEDESK